MSDIREVIVGQQRLRVDVREGTGVPLLICNGLGASLDMLEPFVEALDPQIPVIRFDVPGIGGSPMPRVPYTYFTLACLLKRMLDELGYDKVDVLGISWGGGLAQQLAFQWPRRCRRLVLVSTGTGALMVPARPDVLAKMVTPRRYRDHDYAASVAARLYGGKLKDDPQAVRRLLYSRSRVASKGGYALQLLAVVGWTSLPWLRFIRQQTLIMAGNDDPIVPVVNASIMRRLLPHARAHVYDGGHLEIVASADELAPVVAEFLRPVEGEA